MPTLTTHVLDLAAGIPAVNVYIELYKCTEHDKSLVKTVYTNDDGRTDTPLLTAEEWQAGPYELVFHIGAYFEKNPSTLVDPPFLSSVPVRFSMQKDGGHYHVPLLASPWGYQVYRGS